MSIGNSVRTGSETPGIFFLTTFWGEEFRELFANFCLPSLLSPRNIPALTNKADSCFVIACPQNDWDWLRRQTIFSEASKYLRIQHAAMSKPADHLDAGGRMHHASVGNKLATEEAFKARSYAMIVAPDVVFSDGSVTTLQERAREGYDLVLALGLRSATEPTLQALQNMGLVTPGKPLTLPPRQSVRVFIEHMHSEAAAYRWDKPYYAAQCTSTLFPVGKTGFVVHSLGWTPIFGNYGLLSDHKTTALDEGTIDGRYFHDNFGTNRRFTVIDDSDDLMQLSLTREAVYAFSKKPDPLQQIPLIADFVKLTNLREWATHPIFDDLKRQAFLRCVRLHTEDCGPEWTKAAARSEKIAAAAIVKESRLQRFALETRRLMRYGGIRGGLHELRSLWKSGYRMFTADKDAERSDYVKASGEGIIKGFSFSSYYYSYMSQLVLDDVTLSRVFIDQSIRANFDHRCDRYSDGGKAVMWDYYFITLSSGFYLYAMYNPQCCQLIDFTDAARAGIANARRPFWAAFALGLLFSPLLVGIPLACRSLRYLSEPIPPIGTLRRTLPT